MPLNVRWILKVVFYLAACYFNTQYLEKGLMLVGQLNKFEIWSDVEWHTQITEDIEIGSSADFAVDALNDFSL